MTTFLGSKDAAVEVNYSVELKNGIPITHKTGRQTFLVMGDTMADTDIEALATQGIPPLYYPAAGMFVVRQIPREMGTVKNPTTNQNAILWEIDVEYDSDVVPEPDPDPTVRTPRVSWSSETLEELLVRDAIDDRPIVTACGEPILLTSPLECPVLEINRIESYPFNPNTILAYSQHTNSTVFWGAAPARAKMQRIIATEELIDNQRFCSVTYTIVFHPLAIENPWNARPLHYGTQYREVVGGVAKQWRDQYGNPGTVNLDENGLALATGAPPQFLNFARHLSTNLNALSLGPF